MSDDIENWLDELAGRRETDALHGGLRDYLLALEKDKRAKSDALAFQRLLNRLENEGLLNSSAPNAKPKAYRHWLSGAGLAACLMLSLYIGLGPEFGREYNAATQERAELADSQHQYQAQAPVMAKPSAAPEPTFEMPQDESFSASAKSAPAAAELRASESPSITDQRHQCAIRGANATLRISGTTVEQVWAFYSELNAQGLRFNYLANQRQTIVSPTVNQQQVLSRILERHFSLACDLEQITSLVLSFPVSSDEVLQ